MVPDKQSKSTATLKIREEAARCLLCHDAPCTRACPSGVDPARLIRSLRFENKIEPAEFAACVLCTGQSPAPCESACIHYDFPIRISDLLLKAGGEKSVRTSSFEGLPAPDLSIEFCGVICENPFFLSSSIVASNYEMCARAFDQGWAGIVFKTVGLFVPEELSPRFDAFGKEGTPFVGFRNLEQISDHPLEQNLTWLKKLKRDYPGKVVVASIMGETEAEWTTLAKAVTRAGVDLIECNFSCPHMSAAGLGSDVGQSPELVQSYVKATRAGTHLPILAKMTPNLGNMETPAIAAIEAGADGIAAINTIKSITGLDVDTGSASPAIDGKSAISGLSGKAVKPIALRFIAEMASHPTLKQVPISGMGGIETWKDAVEFLLLGCANIQITTAVMQYGYRIIDDLKIGLSDYLREKRVEHVSDLVGLGLANLVPADKLDRQSICYPRFDRHKCIGCGRCYLACQDAGHQAIVWKQEERQPRLASRKCVGCHLCRLVCPADAIDSGTRVPKP